MHASEKDTPHTREGKMPTRFARLRAGLLTLILLGAGAGVACHQDHEDSELQELLHRLSGEFSSREQALRNPAFSDIRLWMIPMWPHRTSGYWMYVEQAEAGTLDRPYRQRVYHLVAHGDGRYRIEMYALPGDPLELAGAWREEDPLAHLALDDLIPRLGCDVILEVDGEHDFVGGTVGTECESSLRGARYATTRVRISPDRFVSWDRGFDERGIQAWGSLKGGYEFNVIRRTWD